MIIFGGRWGAKLPSKIVDFSHENNGEVVLVKDKISAIYANQNDAKIIVASDLKLAKELQNIATDYLFDAKIAVVVSSENELNAAIDARIDCVILSSDEA